MDTNKNQFNINLKDTIKKIWETKFEQSDIFEQINSIIKSQNYKELDTKLFKSKNGFDKYVFSEELGISFYFNDKDIIESCKEIYIYNIDKKFKKCPFFDTLPYGIAIDWSNKDFVSFFGEPDKKTGGKGLPISLAYERFGFEANFDAYNWETSAATITHLILFKSQEYNKKCCVCQKNVESMKKCAQCNLANYCSKECQAHHWPLHKKLCNNFVEFA